MEDYHTIAEHENADESRQPMGEMRKSYTKRQRNLQEALEDAQAQIERGLIQGGVFATLEQEPVAFGWQTMNPKKTAMTTDSRFDIASVGKVFTASCCASLVVEGKLDPDAPFTEYLPEHILGRNCDIMCGTLPLIQAALPMQGIMERKIRRTSTAI